MDICTAQYSVTGVIMHRENIILIFINFLLRHRFRLSSSIWTALPPHM